MWTESGDRYQEEFRRDVVDMSKSKSMKWLSGGTGSFGTIHRPVPSQPWRPVRMRITGTGSLSPEIQVDVADVERPGRTLSTLPAAGGSIVSPSASMSASAEAKLVLKEMIRNERRGRRKLEKRVSELSRTLEGSRPSAIDASLPAMLSPPIFSPIKPTA